MSKHTRSWVTLLVSVLVCFLGAGCTKEGRKTRHQTKGDRAFAAQHYDEAEIEYLKVLQVAPLDPVALRQLGTIYQEQGKWPRAYAFLKKALELSPDDQQIHLQLSSAYFSLQNRKMAAQEASWVLSKQSGNEEALAVLADSAISLKEVQDTQSQIEKLRQADKDRAAYHVALGTLYLKQLNLTNAEIEIKRALDLEPQSAVGNMVLGNLYWLTNNTLAADKAFKSAAELSSIRSARRLKYAEFKLSTRAVEAAKSILQDITQNAPDYLPAWNLLAQVALGERRFDECNSCLQRVMARDPVNYDALLLMGNLKLVRGDTAQAVAEFEHMASLYDRSPQVQFQLARAYLLNGDTSKAIPKLNRAIASDKNFSDAILLLANLNLRKGETATAVFSLKELLKRQPQLPQAYLLLANAYLAQKEPDQAVNVCQQMEVRFPKSPEVSLVLGSVYAKENHPDQARQAFERSLELSPNYLPALEQIVDLDLADKKYAAALDRVTHQIDRQAGAAEPWLLLAKVHIAKAQSYLETGKPTPQERSKTTPGLGEVPAAQPDVTQAERALLKSIQLNPGLRNSYFMLASLYVSCNKQTQALDRLTEFLSKTNDVVAWMQVGIIHDKLKDYSAARDAYAKVLALNPNFSLALNNLAYLYSEHFGDLNKAYQMAEKARKLLPDDPSTADTLGWILFKRGEYERALGIIEESAAKLSNDPEVAFHLGMAHYMLVEEDPARLAFEQATQDSKDFAGKDEARRRLKVLAIDAKTAKPSTVADLKQYLHDSPADPVALSRLGAIDQRDGAIDEALQSYEAALKCSPQNPRLLLKLAQLYSSHASPDRKKAMELAKQAHSLAPDNPRVSAILGRLVLDAGDSKWSASLLEDSARQLPGDPDISYDLAWADYSLGRISDALSAMAAAQNAPSRAEDAKRFVRLVSAARDEATSEALTAEANKALSAEPGYVPALAVSAIDEERKGNFQQAAKLYDRVLQVFPLFAPATRNLAILCYQHLGDDSKAYSLATSAREALPQDSEIAKVLGILEYRKTNYRRAVQLLRESASNRKEDAELFYFLGMAQYQLKARGESRAALEQALALNVEPKFANDAKRVLLELK